MAGRGRFALLSSPFSTPFTVGGWSSSSSNRLGSSRSSSNRLTGSAVRSDDLVRAGGAVMASGAAWFSLGALATVAVGCVAQTDPWIELAHRIG
jgi:hypothetical protein